MAAVGSEVKDFQVGERVAGFHEMDTSNGAYAEYAICPAQTVFHIPDKMSFEEAATFPLAIFTAAVGLFSNLQIPAPWDRSDEKAADRSQPHKQPLVINGASSAVGAFAVKLAKLNGRNGPIIATAGGSQDFVKSLGVDAVVDYRSDSLVEDIKKAAGGVTIKHFFDASNTVSSVKTAVAVLASDGRYTCTTPLGKVDWMGRDGSMGKMLEEAGLWFDMIWVGEVHGMARFGTNNVRAGGELFGAVVSKTIETSLAAGKFGGHPHQIVEGGLHGVKEALEELRDRKQGGNRKMVTRIADTKS